jgi:hypothetical protein
MLASSIHLSFVTDVWFSCFNSPGGALLQTQFWDTAPVTGPVDSWTVHGLWPDNCDGTYEASCDDLRAYTNISAILQSAGKTELLDCGFIRDLLYTRHVADIILKT